MAVWPALPGADDSRCYASCGTAPGTQLVWRDRQSRLRRDRRWRI